MTEKQLFTYTNAVICSELLSSYLEELRHTPVYRQQIRHLSTNLSAELEKILKIELPKIFDVDEMFTLNLMRNYKDLVELITSSQGDDLMVLSQLIKEYNKDRDKFLDKFQIMLTKLDD